MLLRVVYSQHTEVGSFSAIWLHVTLLWFLGGHIPHSTKTGFINFYVSGELFLYNCIIWYIKKVTNQLQHLYFIVLRKFQGPNIWMEPYKNFC